MDDTEITITVGRRERGGQTAGTDRGTLTAEHSETGIRVTLPVNLFRSQHRTRRVAVDMIKWALLET